MIVGNIITKEKIKKENFNIFNTLNEVKNDLPTLIIGWGITKEIYGDKVSILHKKIDDNIYWTFDSKERKVDLETDFINFENYCYNIIGKNIPYIFVDVIHDKKRKIKKIINKINSLQKPISYLTKNNMLYIYGDNLIFGIDLNILGYIGIKKEKIISRINPLVEGTLSENEIFNKCKEIAGKINNGDKMIPYIYENGKQCKDNDISVICE